MVGYIHSQESFGTVDGPGVRYVVFFQGCPMRCQYCHNPDTWEVNAGTEITVEEIMKNYRKNRPFYTKGGLTVTGGEPLLQIDFLLELFKEAKKENIHTCIDTSGITYRIGNQKYNEKLDELNQREAEIKEKRDTLLKQLNDLDSLDAVQGEISDLKEQQKAFTSDNIDVLLEWADKSGTDDDKARAATIRGLRDAIYKADEDGFINDEEKEQLNALIKNYSVDCKVK